MRCHRHLLHRGAIGTYYIDKNIIVFYIIMVMSRYSRDARAQFYVGSDRNMYHSMIHIDFKRIVVIVMCVRTCRSACARVLRRPWRSEGPGGDGPRKAAAPPRPRCITLHFHIVSGRWAVGGWRLDVKVVWRLGIKVGISMYVLRLGVKVGISMYVPRLAVKVGKS